MADEKVLGAASLTRPIGRGARRVLGPVLSERGQSLVEFAMVVPLILLLVLGIVDFGLAYNYKNDQTSLANQALRYAVVNDCQPCGGQKIEQYIKSTSDSAQLRDGNSAGSWGIQTPGVQITICLPPGSSGAVGEPIEAIATSDYQWLPALSAPLPFVGARANLAGPAHIQSQAIGRIEPGAGYTAPGGGGYAYDTPLDTCPS
jgi:hypothetical protein